MIHCSETLLKPVITRVPKRVESRDGFEYEADYSERNNRITVVLLNSHHIYDCMLSI